MKIFTLERIRDEAVDLVAQILLLVRQGDFFALDLCDVLADQLVACLLGVGAVVDDSIAAPGR